jgi:hypothetical protein
MNKRLREVRAYLWRNRNASNRMDVIKNIAAVVRGWVNYFAISDSGPRVWRFINRVQHLIHKWFNQRGGNRYISWEMVQKVLDEEGISGEFKIRSTFPTQGKQTNH